MGFLDKAKAAAETAAEKTKEAAQTATSKAKEGVDDVQTKRALGNAYENLGHTAYGLAKSGAIAHPDLTESVEEITRLEAHLADEDQPAAPEAAAAEAPAAAEPEPAGQAPSA